MKSESPINLLPPAHRARRRKAAAIRRWCAAGVVELLLVAVAGAGVHWISHVDDRSVKGEILRIQQEQEQIDSRRSERAATLQLVKSQMQLRDTVNAPPDYSKMLALLSDALADEGLLFSMKWDVAPVMSSAAPPVGADGKPLHLDPFAAGERLQLQLTGIVKTQAAITHIVERIQKSGLFDEVRLVKSGRDAFLGEDAFSFQLSCNAAGGPASGATP